MGNISEKRQMMKKSTNIIIDSFLFIFVIVVLLIPIKGGAAELPPVQISTTNPPTYYQTLQDAYNAASNNAIIKSRNKTFDSLNINQGTNVTFQGGYNSDFSSVIGSTYINEMITVGSGTATIGSFKIISPPEVSISSPTSGFIKIKTPTLIYSACCGLASVKVDDIVVSKLSGGTLDTLADGQHVVRVDTTDSAGSPVFTTATFTVDTIAPVVTISSPVSGITKTNNPVFNYTVSDGSVVVELDGSIISIASGAKLGILTDGPHTVRVESTDLANNIGSAEVTFTLDTVGTGAPVVTITSPVSGFTKTNNPLLNYTVSNGSAVVKVDEAVVNKTSGALLDTLADGIHTVRIEAINTFNSKAVEVTFTVDTIPPSVTIISPSPQVTNNDTPALSYTVSDGTVVVKLDGAIVPITSGSTLGLLADGSHTVRVESTDIAGNTGFAQVSFSIDTSSNNGVDQDATNVYCNGTEKYIAGSSNFTSGMSIPVAGSNGILIDLPIDGSTIDGPLTIIKGAIDTTIPVNKVMVQVSTSPTDTRFTSYSAQVNGNYYAAKVALVAGANAITAISYDKNGGQQKATVSIYAVMQSNSVDLSATPGAGIPTTQQNGQIGLDVVLLAAPTFSNAVATYTWDFNDSGSNQLKCHTHSGVGAEYQQLGLYLARVTVTDISGNMYSDTEIVNVLNTAEMNTVFTSTWNRMKTSLLAGDITTALADYSENTKSRYQQIFGQLISSNSVDAIYSNITDIVVSNVDDRIAECWALRPESDGTHAYPVTFVKDENGEWKIMGY